MKMNIQVGLIVLVAMLLATCGRPETSVSQPESPLVSQQPASAKNGLILYKQLDDTALASREMKVIPDLIVADASGKELRRIALPGLQMHDGLALEAGNRAIYSAADATYLVDAAAGTATKLPISARNLMPDPALQAGQWGVFEDRHSERAYLVNLAVGTATDLNALTGAAALYPNTLSADGEYVFSSGRTAGWLIPTADPAAMRKVASGGSFSHDTAWIIYTETSDAANSVVLERLDGSERRIIATDPGTIRAEFVLDSQAILLDTSTDLAIYDRASDTTQVLLRYPDDTLYFSVSTTADGAHTLVKIAPDSPAGAARRPTSWSLINLADRTVQRLDALDDLDRPAPSLSRWFVFGGAGLDGPGPFIILDTRTGTLSQPIPSQSFFPPLGDEASVDGTVMLLYNVVGSGLSSRYGVISTAGEVREVARGISADLSPDGAQMIVGTFAYGATADTAQLAIFSTTDASVIELGAGIEPVWLNP